jgi:hypothetical protein
MSGATTRSTAPQGGMLPLSAAITPFVTAWTLSLPLLVSGSPGNPPFPPLSLARSAVAQTSASTRGRRGVTSISTSLALPHSQLPTCCTSFRRYAVLLSRQQPPVAFQAFAFETFGGLHADALALLQRLQGLLNQALIAQEDVEGYLVIRRVSFIIAAAVGRQLAARRV